MPRLIHIPAMRAGKIFQGGETVPVPDFSSNGHGDTAGEEALPGRGGGMSVVLTELTARQMLDDAARAAENPVTAQPLEPEKARRLCRDAAEFFRSAPLPAPGAEKGGWQSPEDYLTALARSTGLSPKACRENMEVLCREIRGIEPDSVSQGGISWSCKGGLRVLMPAGPPALHALWLPAVIWGVPVTVHPAPEDPWTPWRLIQSFISAGAPASAFSFSALHPSAYPYLAQLPDIRILPQHFHPFTAVMFAETALDNWQGNLNWLAENMLHLGGRSPLSPRLIIVPRRADDVAYGLVRKMEKMLPASLPEHLGMLSLQGKQAAHSLTQRIEEESARSAVQDITAKRRKSSALLQHNNGTCFLPTILRCQSVRDPLAQVNQLLPITAIVEAHDPVATAAALPLGSRIFAVGLGPSQIERLRSTRTIAEVWLGRVSPADRPLFPDPAVHLFPRIFRRVSFRDEKQSAATDSFTLHCPQ